MMFEERKQKKWTARANACDEQLARFEDTRRKAAANRPNGNQTNNENQGSNQMNVQCFCRQCGAAKVEGAVFCGKCGTKISSSFQQPYVPEANVIVNGSPTNPNYQPSPKPLTPSPITSQPSKSPTVNPSLDRLRMLIDEPEDDSDSDTNMDRILV